MKLYSGKSAVEVLSMEDEIKASTKLAYFIKHIEQINAKELVEYILNSKGDGFIKETNTRKLFMAYSLSTERIIKKI